MDCSTLKMLIENHEPVNLIDIRPKKEFREMHIIGARSLPFATLASTKGFLDIVEQTSRSIDSRDFYHRA